MQFIKALYASSQMTVRVGAGKMARFAEPFALCRGVRQG